MKVTAKQISRSPTLQWITALVILAGLALFLGANAHLIYVAVSSHPGCVAHLKDAGSEPGEFRAAQSSC
jgi:hypothetical protein